MSITLPDVAFEPRGVIKCYTGDRKRMAGGPEGLLATLTPFKSGGNAHAHRYNVPQGAQSGYTGAPPAGGGKMPTTFRIPATAVYVLWSYQTPIAWVDADGTVTVPDVTYSPTTTIQQNKARAWLGASVPGVTRWGSR